MGSEIYVNDNDLFEKFEKKLKEIIDEFITVNSKTNIINKRKYYVYKFFVDDVNLLYVHGCFNNYDEKDYEFILKNNYTDCGNLDDLDNLNRFTCRKENIDCYFELEGLLYLDKIKLNEINQSHKKYTIFNKELFTYGNKEHIKYSAYINEFKKCIHLEILKSIALNLDKERNKIYSEYSKNLAIPYSGFIICIETKTKDEIYRDFLFSRNKSVTNSIISLYKKSEKDNTMNKNERTFRSSLHRFKFGTDKIKFINYFANDEDIYDKYIYDEYICDK